jgi:hypothetical protein
LSCCNIWRGPVSAPQCILWHLACLSSATQLVSKETVRSSLSSSRTVSSEMHGIPTLSDMVTHGVPLCPTCLTIVGQSLVRATAQENVLPSGQPHDGHLSIPDIVAESANDAPELQAQVRSASDPCVHLRHLVRFPRPAMVDRICRVCGSDPKRYESIESVRCQTSSRLLSWFSTSLPSFCLWYIAVRCSHYSLDRKLRSYLGREAVQ